MTSVQATAARVVCVAIWGACLIVGSYQATVYSYTPGEVMAERNSWPAESGVLPASDRPTMLIGLHPRCVCSRATLEELSRLVAQAATPVRIEILMFHPGGSNDTRAETGLALQARAIPGVTLRPDPDGLEAKNFGLSTSGHTLVYGLKGELLFSGGITPARGHAGDNDGRAAIVSLLSNRQPPKTRTPVFGCGIRDQA